MSEPLDDMYRDIILDHYRSPRGRKPLKKVDVTSDGSNPSCGDEVFMEVELDNGTVKDIHIDCHGCAISVASASMLAEIVKGKSIAQTKIIAETVKRMLKGENTEIPDDIGDLDALKGVRNFPVRIKCALLAWVTLLEGIKNYEKGNRNDHAKLSTEDNE